MYNSSKISSIDEIKEIMEIRNIKGYTLSFNNKKEISVKWISKGLRYIEKYILR